MYIEPNTTIYLLRNIPMDNSYRDSLYFASETAQINYFTSKIALTFNNQTYQRKGRGYIRLQCDTPAKMSTAYNCNYVMFKNTSFENKWFYAFITSVEYINNAVLEIQYEIDVLQTWYFDYEMDECFIQREHVPDDSLGLHTLPEPVEIDNVYVTDEEDEILTTSGMNWTAIIYTSYFGSGQAGEHPENEGTVVSGLFSGSRAIPVDLSFDHSYLRLQWVLSALVQANAVESITAILMIPTEIIDGLYEADWSGISADSVGIPEVTWNSVYPADKRYSCPFTRPGLNSNDTLDGYVPRNKKMFTFPYTCLYVHNTVGQSQVYRFEQFDYNGLIQANKPPFKLWSQFAGNAEMILMPMGYKGQSINFTETVPMSEFPLLSFNYDVYKAWLASGGRAETILNLVGGATTAIASGMSGNLYGTIQGGYQVANTAIDIYKKAIEPNKQVGTNQGSTAVANRFLNFKFLRQSVRREVAITIDNFFTRFGYNVSIRKRPNKHNRTRYTYIKTVDSTLSGSIPVNDANKICHIYDSGITWWADHDNVGNYSYTNSTL